MEPGESIEVFKSEIISNDKTKEREQKLSPCKVDRLLVNEDGKPNEDFSRAKILELLGCYHHVCPQCCADRLEVNENTKLSVGDLHLVSVDEKSSSLRKTKRTQNNFFNINLSEYICR